MTTHIIRYVRRESRHKGGDRHDHRTWSGLTHKTFHNDLSPTPWARKRRVKQLTLTDFVNIRLKEPWLELLWIDDRCIYEQSQGLLVPQETWLEA